MKLYNNEEKRDLLALYEEEEAHAKKEIEVCRSRIELWTVNKAGIAEFAVKAQIAKIQCDIDDLWEELKTARCISSRLRKDLKGATL